MSLPLLIKNAQIITPLEIISGHLIIKENKILDILTQDIPDNNFEVIDAQGNYLSPGFINIHIHGYGDTNNNEPLDIMDGITSIKRISKILCTQGITSFLPTTISTYLSHLLEVMEDIKNVHNFKEGANILGLHLEGPYITSPGIHSDEIIKKSKELSIEDLKQEIKTLYKKSGENLKILTICPVFKGKDTIELIKYIDSLGVVISIGHTIASYEETQECIKNGAKMATHIFNAMPPLHHRKPGAVGALLEDKNVMVEVIPDCTDMPHVHPSLIKLIVKAKGIDNVITITDSSPVSGLENGKYYIFGEQEVIKENDKVYILKDESNKKLAGSVLSMNRAIKNMIDFVELDLEDAIKTVTLNPAKLLNLSNKGLIKKGFDADLTIFDKSLNILFTIINGKVVYSK